MLFQHAGGARFAYNWGLAGRIELYETKKECTNAIEQHKLLNSLKSSEFPWMYESSKCVFQEALRDLDKSFKNFYRGLKSGEKIGFPAFKKKGVKDSFRLTGTIKITGKEVQLPRLGKTKLKEESSLKGKICSATVLREADRWFVSILVEEKIPDPVPVIGNAVGADVGILHFVTYSDGTKVPSPKALEKNLKGLNRCARQHARKQRGSNNRKKSCKKLSRKYRRTRNIRKDFLHKESTKLAKTKSVIVVEKLNIKGMLKNRRLSRKISDAGWGEFFRMLEYKTQWYGSQLMIAPRFYPSSKICSACDNYVKELPLSVREWQCAKCNKIHDRDVNAAENLLKLSTWSSQGTLCRALHNYACGDTSGGAGQNPASHVSLKQELMSGHICP
jgi:putative transposase